MIYTKSFVNLDAECVDITVNHWLEEMSNKKDFTFKILNMNAYSKNDIHVRCFLYEFEEKSEDINYTNENAMKIATAIMSTIKEE